MMTRRGLPTIGFLLGLALAFAIAAPGQTTSGSISGTVTDSTGQVVPASAVLLINESTGEERRTATNEAGFFVFTALPPGPYTVKVEFKGFKSYESKNNIVVA